jgi:hypothetical protein
VATVLVAVAVILGLLVLLLAVPVNVAFELAGIAPMSGQVCVRALFGLIQFRIPVPVAQEAPEHPVSRRRRTGGGGGANALHALRQAAFRRRVYRLARDLFSASHLHQVHLRMRLGLGDPADTGLLWAFVGPLNAVAQGMPNVDVGIEPDFMEPVCEFELHGHLMLIPLQLLTLAIAFALSPTSIRVWRTL